MSATFSAEALPFSEEGFHQFLSGSEEPSWLLDSRREAWNRYVSMPWPSRNDEQWMRSDLRGFKIDRYRMPSREVSSTLKSSGIPEWLADGVTPAGVIRCLDGQTIHSELDADLQSKGVVFGDLAWAAEHHPKIVQAYLNQIVDSNSDRFAALHAAVWSGGQILYVPRGVSVQNPFRVAVGMTDGATDTGHTLIVIEEGAEATFLYESNSPSGDAGGLHLGAVEIIVKPGGILRYVNLQDWGRKVWHFAHQRASVGRSASIQWTVAALGSQFSQVSQQVALVGENADSQVNGVMFTQDKQQLTYNTLQHHQAPSCRSDFLYKSALQDRSRTVWRGMIQVDQLAQKTDGYQRNDNLLLSDQARADSIPGLEIEADDVRCTHGSTSGKVDEELIFYAQSRGLTCKEAVRMIVAGFFQQIFDRITIPSVREALGQAIARQVREVR